MVGELRDGEIEEYEVRPGDFGLDSADLAAPARGRAGSLQAHAARRARRPPGAGPRHRALNAGAALYAAGVAASIGEGIDRARAAMAGGGARAKLTDWVDATQRFGAAMQAEAH